MRSRIANINSIAFVRTGIVCSERLAVFAFDSIGEFSILQAVVHTSWLNCYGSTMRTDILYTPSDCFETYPFPREVENLESIGKSYLMHRQTLMSSNQEGLTRTYTRFHNPNEVSVDIHQLRALHLEMDHLVAAAYGWSDLDLGHDFHETRQGIRFTICEPARREILDRLLALNHERYKAEIAEGLHEKSAGKNKSSGNKKRKKEDNNTIVMSF